MHLFIRAIRYVLHAAALLPAIFSLSACQSTGSIPGDIDRIDKPTYQAGQYFTFDNNRTEYVEKVENNRVFWRTGRGFTFVTDRDFTLPRLEWTWQDRHGVIEFISHPDNSIWPLGPDQEAAFTSRYVVDSLSDGSSNAGRAQRWSCATGETENITVKAGQFRTYPVTCTRRTGTSRRLYRTWYFAPEIGHYVLRIDQQAPRFRVRRTELLSWGMSLKTLPAPIRKELRKIAHEVLEKRKSGVAIAWEIDGDAQPRYSGHVTVLRTFKTKKGVFCRDYRLSFQLGGRQVDQNRTACREKGGNWREVS